MNKIVLGVLVGAGLGFFDGLTAWFTPAVRPMLESILVGSSLKGLLMGLAAGFFARKSGSTRNVVIFAGAVAFVLAFLVASMPGENGEHYWLQILLPGTIVGLMTGYLIQRYGRTA
jgi:hypothetical protein